MISHREWSRPTGLQLGLGQNNPFNMSWPLQACPRSGLTITQPGGLHPQAQIKGLALCHSSRKGWHRIDDPGCPALEIKLGTVFYTLPTVPALLGFHLSPTRWAVRKWSLQQVKLFTHDCQVGEGGWGQGEKVKRLIQIGSCKIITEMRSTA